MKQRTALVTREALTSVGGFEDWAESVSMVLEAQQKHPTGGMYSGLNVNSIRHLRAQATLVEAVDNEKSVRNALKAEIADPGNGDLDTIGKIALLKGMDSFNPLPNNVELDALKARTEHRGAVGYFTTYAALQAVEAIPSGVEGSLWVASMIDASLREIDRVAKDGVRVQVDEKHNWGEFRTLYTPGHRETFSRQITHEGVIESAAQSLELKPPTITESGKVSYHVPSFLQKVRITNRSGESDRDAGGEFFPAGKTTMTVSNPQHGPERMTVPLIGLMRAQGLEVSRYIEPFEGENGKSLSVTVGRKVLSDLS